MRDAIKLSNGTEFDAIFGVVGIKNNSDGGFSVYEGYDCDLYIDEWSTDDRVALADRMIAMWEAFKDAPNA